MGPNLSTLWLNLDNLRLGLTLLTVLIIALSINASLSIGISPNAKPYFFLITLLGALSILTFSLTKILSFYIAFEGSLLPIFLIVMGWGYQPERLSAAFALFFYTLVASLPLLVLIMNLRKSSRLNDFTLRWQVSRSSSLSSVSSNFISIFLIRAFIAKLPVFIVHQWLPKAHVEAPVAGSMLLAAILLKLGGCGLFRFYPFFRVSLEIMFILISIILLGGAFIGLLCLRQLDIKVLIAYSSVSHISFVAVGFLINSLWASAGAIFIIIAHGVCSSGMFAGANLIYLRSHSRLITLNKGILRWSPAFSLVWFLICLGNIGAPPTINLVREIFRIIGMVNFNAFTIIAIALTTFLAAAYTLILYSTTQQGEKAISFIGVRPLSYSDLLIIVSHLVWLLFLVVSLPILF